MRRKSYIADSIVYEYNRKKRYEDRKNFIDETCEKCINKYKDLCDIRLGIDGKWRCVNYEDMHN